MNEKNWIEGGLPILMSCRVRLTNDQRQQLKAAYSAKRQEFLPAQASNGRVGVVTSYGSATGLDSLLGFSQLVFNDLVNSRDSIGAPIVLKLQSVLGVDLLSKEQVMETCQSYVDHIWKKADE